MHDRPTPAASADEPPRRAASRARRSTSRASTRTPASARCSTRSTATSSGLAPVKRRVREIAALLLVERVRERMGLSAERAVAAHVLHRQPGHRQDHGRHADGRDPAPPRLRAQGARRRGHARRPRRPVHRAHGAEDQGRAQARHGRRALHRRGVLPAPPGEREGLRPGGHRDPAAGDGEPARRPRRDPRRLQGPHGRVLRVATRAWRRASRTTSTSPTTPTTSCSQIAEKMLAEWNYRFDAGGRGRVPRVPRASAARGRTSRTRAACATRSTASACARRCGCSRRAAPR